MNLSLGSKGLVVNMDPEQNHLWVFEVLSVVQLAFMTSIYCGVLPRIVFYFFKLFMIMTLTVKIHGNETHTRIMFW